MLVKQLNTGNLHIAAGESGCCPDTANPVCKYSFAIIDLASITSITIDGNVHTITATDETDLGDIALAIENAFLAEGYKANDFNPHILLYENAWEDTATIINVYTNASSVTLTTVPAVDTSVKACIKTVACRYHAEIPVGAGLSFEISDEEVEAADAGNSPQTVNGDFATGQANALAEEIATELTALYAGTENVTVKRVRVIENTITEMYEVDVWLYGRHPLVTDDESIEFVRCECEVDYTALNS